MTRIVLLRHGQTEWNRVERFRGRADVPLDQTGIAQAEATGRRVSSEFRPAAIYASPLSRAVRTAEAIAKPLGGAVVPLRGLIDVDYGEWQGLTPEEVARRWPEALAAWYQTPSAARIPGGETLVSVRERAMAEVAEVASRHADATAVLVAHTVVNRLILLAVLGLGVGRFWAIRQDTCAVNVFEADGEDYTLVCLNDTCHLRA